MLEVKNFPEIIDHIFPLFQASKMKRKENCKANNVKAEDAKAEDAKAKDT